MPGTRPPSSTDPGQVANGSREMLDVIFIAGGIAFFAVSLGYTFICERL